MVSAAVLPAKRQHGGAEEDGHEHEGGDAVGPVDVEEDMSRQSQKHDAGLVHAEVCLLRIGHHSVARKGVVDTPFSLDSSGMVMTAAAVITTPAYS